jgi:predicted RNA-binding Zn-ribbon protein involved in translation (DUF1610 family)
VERIAPSCESAVKEKPDPKSVQGVKHICLGSAQRRLLQPSPRAQHLGCAKLPEHMLNRGAVRPGEPRIVGREVRGVCRGLVQVSDGEWASITMLKRMAPATSPEERIPAREKTAFDCPNCNIYAKQTWRRYYRYGGRGFDEAHDLPVQKATSAEEKTKLEKSGSWYSAECDHCGKFSSWRDDELIYPRVSGIVPPAADMPPEVVDLYNEAREVMAVSRRAGAALARATLEKLLKLLKEPDATQPKNASLADRIEAMVPKVSSSLGEMLTIIRHLGNKTIHPEDEPDDAVVLVLDESQTELAGLLFESINELVDQRITKPATSKRFLGMVPDNVLKKVKGLNRE